MTNEAVTHDEHNDDGRILHAHNPSYGIHLKVWMILVSLTVITVAVAGIDLGQYTLFVALLIAAIKSSLVINIFMHIKFDDIIFKVFIVLVIATLAVILILTGFDVFFRG
jgi:cytochrome c oxidase subunit 4